ncbi:MAG: hypothetical protein V4584_08620 [Verrucomicrobiota bacterium]
MPRFSGLRAPRIASTLGVQQSSIFFSSPFSRSAFFRSSRSRRTARVIPTSCAIPGRPAIRWLGIEKQGILTISTERGAMDEAFHTEMGAHPELVPSYVDTAELARDRKLRGDLLEILQRSREVCDSLEDTAHVTGSDVLMGYLSFYSSVRQAAKRGVADANTLLENLSRFFPRTRRAAVAPPAA